MEELTIKINKTTLFIFAALLVGFILGYSFSLLKSGKASAKKSLSGALINTAPSQNVPAGNNTAPDVVQSNITLTPDDHRLGADDPKVILVEYSDFQCPFCQRFHPTMKKIIEEYKDQVLWVYRHFPLSFHQNAEIASLASECAAEQGKFWEYADLIFAFAASDGTGLEAADLKKHALNLKLNTEKFNRCLDSGKYKARVDDDLGSGAAAGINGTPGTIMIDKNGGQRLISGAVPYEQIKAAVLSAL